MALLAGCLGGAFTCWLASTAAASSAGVAHCEEHCDGGTQLPAEAALAGLELKQAANLVRKEQGRPA